MNLNKSLKSFKANYLNHSSNIYYLVMGLFFSSIINTSLQGTFHNYLNDIFQIGADQRGLVEFPRELPGLLTFFLISFFIFLGEIKLISFSIILTGIGLLGLGFLSPNFSSMIFFMFIWSTGMHIHVSLREPVALELSSDPSQRGTILGKLNAVRSIGIIAGTSLIWLLMGKFKFNYAQMYLGGFFISLVSAGFYAKIKIKKKKEKVGKFKFILKRKYILFYILSALFGVRKQLFLVFGPWLLIKFYDQKPEDLAKLLLISAFLGILVKPYLGRLVDRWGERQVLFYDAILIFILSLTYGLAPKFFSTSISLLILYACFILDELLFSLRIARTTYLHKIIESQKDFTPTISMGISIEHLVSMIAPIFAGFIWIKFGYLPVFIIAAFFACLSALLTLKMPIKIKK